MTAIVVMCGKSKCPDHAEFEVTVPNFYESKARYISMYCLKHKNEVLVMFPSAEIAPVNLSVFE